MKRDKSSNDNDLYHGSGESETDIMRHSAEHVMAAAIMSLWPQAKRGVGPAVENGFYQDLEIPGYQISPEDLPKIEQKMNQLKNKKLPFIRTMKPINEAIDYEKNNNQQYKVEILEDLKKNGEKEVSYYQTGDYTDLCKGPHVADTSKIGFYKLDRLAGAYWRGSEKNQMLQRVYGLSFPTKEELEKFLHIREEAKKRDHRVLGKTLDLYVISDTIGKGLPLLTARGTILRNQILAYEQKLGQKNGFQYVTTPAIARSELYKRTGHWQHYREVMYAPFGIEGEEYVLKPMNCPHHYMIYESKPRSYRELPIRLSEAGTCYRFEKTGELSGLLRVRALTIDDTHILMKEDQIEEEFKRCIRMIAEMFKAFGLTNYYVRLSLSDPSDAIKYIADEATWEKAGKLLEKIVKDNDLNYVVARGEASFYGPKIDYMVKDSLGREWQMSTLQLDLFMGKRLGLKYIDAEGKEQHPVIAHLGLTGSIERTLAVLIEHFAGKFPVWLSPVQVALIPIADRNGEFAIKIHEALLQSGIRSEVNQKASSMQAKIRDATLQKVPYMGIIGDKESSDKENLQLSVRTREGKNLGLMKLDHLLERIQKEIEKKL